MKYDDIDAKIIKLLQEDIPLQSHPFAELASSLAIPETEVLERIRAMQDRGIIRRWGAVLRHQQAGYNANAMVAWRADEEKADEYGKIMATVQEVSHCYLREVPRGFDYSIFTMVHARSDQELTATIEKIAELTGLTDYSVLKSLREFKKVSMKYIV